MTLPLSLRSAPALLMMSLSVIVPIPLLALIIISATAHATERPESCRRLDMGYAAYTARYPLQNGHPSYAQLGAICRRELGRQARATGAQDELLRRQMEALRAYEERYHELRQRYGGDGISYSRDDDPFRIP